MTAPPSQQPQFPQPGEVLEGKYEVQRVLGTGAMGAVIRATHLLRKAPVALKFLSPKLLAHERVVQRFLNEGVAASQIDSDHVVKILDVSRLPSGVPYIVMEYLEGLDLAELLAQQGKPGLADAARVTHFALQALRGLQVAHRAGVVHRDMKPANCFVVERHGEPDFLKIVDFGISKLTQPDALKLTKGHAALGTPLYMSPEQARNPANVDARSDLYAVAVIVYELLSGVTPYRPETGTFSELLMQLASDTPAGLDTLCDALPRGLSALVARGLSKRPEDRYQSAADMAEALAPFADARSEHVLRQLLQRTPAGVSRFPPRAGAPTEVDAEAGGATVVIADGGEPAGAAGGSPEVAISQTVPVEAVSAVGATGPAVREGAAAAPPPMADTAEGTVREPSGTRASAGRRRLAVALGLAAVVVALVVWLGRTAPPESLAAPSAEISVAATTPAASGAPPALTTIAPPADAAAASTTSADAAASAVASAAESARPAVRRPAGGARSPTTATRRPKLGDITIHE